MIVNFDTLTFKELIKELIKELKYVGFLELIMRCLAV